MTDHDAPPPVARHLLLFIIRLSGVALVMAGFLLIAGRVSVLGSDADRMVGALLVLVGAAAYALIPFLLARRWRGPRAP